VMAAFTSAPSSGAFSPSPSCSLSAAAATGQAPSPVTRIPGQAGYGTQAITTVEQRGPGHRSGPGKQQRDQTPRNRRAS